jgi:hypothetical protein
MAAFSRSTGLLGAVLVTILVTSASEKALANTDRKAVSLLPTHVATVVGINLQQCRVSKLCRRVVRAAKKAESWDTILTQLERASGLNVSAQAKRLYIGLPVDFETSNAAVVILDGPIRPMTERRALAQNVRQTRYRSYPVWTFPGSDAGSFVTLGDRLLFANEKRDLFVVLDRLQALKNLDGEPARPRRMDVLAARAATHMDVWFIRDMEALRRAGQVRDPIWRQTRVILGAANFHRGIDLRANLLMNNVGAAAVITGWIHQLHGIPFQSQLLGLMGMGSIGDHLTANPRGRRVEIQMQVRPQELSRLLATTLAWLH